MTKEEKEILLRDLSARLAYGVKCIIGNENVYTLTGIEQGGCYFEGRSSFFGFDSFTIMPYLRRISSMTKDELNEYENMIENEDDEAIRFCNLMFFYGSHHFDYRGLIDMKLAIEAPDEDIITKKAKEYSFNIPSKLYTCYVGENSPILKLWKEEIEKAYEAGWNASLDENKTKG